MKSKAAGGVDCSGDLGRYLNRLNEKEAIVVEKDRNEGDSELFWRFHV